MCGSLGRAALRGTAAALRVLVTKRARPGRAGLWGERRFTAPCEQSEGKSDTIGKVVNKACAIDTIPRGVHIVLRTDDTCS
eukprot:257645-Prorocentrum_minimum.AAC.4